jgi:fructose-bisphosphate aldolase class II
LKTKPGVIYGQQLKELYAYASEEGMALPAVNVVGSSSVNAVLECAREAKSPVIIQLSHGGASFYAGKALEGHAGAIRGAVCAALSVHQLASSYGVSVVLHTDHAARGLLPWIDGLILESEAYYKANQRPLFSSHMLDLSEEPLDQNIATCKEYLERMTQSEISLEIELGITGGEEDGVDNSDVDSSKLYTRPEEVYYAYKELQEVRGHFTVAASFGNVHGVYRPGNVVLNPKILRDSQDYLCQKINNLGPKPIPFVFHGGSGSELSDIQEAISYGVIKMNLDTDLQWAFWDGVRSYESKNHDYLQAQMGNPNGSDSPNKKYYDPRKWLREAELSMKDRLMRSFKDLNCLR